MPNNSDKSHSPTNPRAKGHSWKSAALPDSLPNVAGSSDAEGERWTVGRLLTWTTDYLKRRGSESARLDAEVLLAKALGWARVQLYTHFEEEVGEQVRGDYREMVRRRSEGAPVAYLVGSKEFYSLRLKVGPAVLIPRPDSEFVVVEFLTVTKGMENPRCVDVGTGSGCLALACVHEHPSALFFATDISGDALIIARENAQVLGLAPRVTFREGNLLDPVCEEGPYDVIVSNPPYIATEVISQLERGVRDFEPHGALDGGYDGLQIVSELIKQATELLKPGGRLILEIGSDQELSVRSLLSSQGNLTVAPTVRDHSNHPRVLRATKH